MVGLRSQIWIPDHFFIFFTIAELGILGDLLAFPTQSPPNFFTRLGEITGTDKVMTPPTTFMQRSGRHPDPD